jgi:hypothetical protein
VVDGVQAHTADLTRMARQLTLWAVVLLMIAVVAAAVAPAPEKRVTPAFPAPAPPGAPAPRTVDATLPSRTPVAAAVGDVVRLRVVAARPDRVTVAGLGVSAPVGPGSAGQVELVTDLPGRWSVRLESGGAAIGVLEVAR